MSGRPVFARIRILWRKPRGKALSYVPRGSRGSHIPSPRGLGFSPVSSVYTPLATVSGREKILVMVRRAVLYVAGFGTVRRRGEARAVYGEAFIEATLGDVVELEGNFAVFYVEGA
ncbi:hypothetical protein [Pyrobaculum sp.]|uniref:hypothetical protein n=1 Tax=Pyrobaculum sp. TaxID=2004705 RepID=UPI003D0D9315